MIRHLLLALALATPALAQTGARNNPAPKAAAATRPKVIATPPTVAPVPTQPTPAAPTKPVVRKRPARPVDPVAAYTPKVKAAFAKRWAEAVQPHMDEFNRGSVAVAFKLDPEGKVTDFAVTENTSNEAFAKFCEQFVRETEFEKPPAKALKDGLLEIPFTFWIY